ncbi:exodeoxyribonuclease V subunit beta [Alteromonas sp. McT4-15]|uniref:exodeoxyribonuclease V subunit beta n=1 Tax=Alteromonas sp. McT4-15 TaxID=2881256 RepID=UPI001CF7F249|nr:exodeoxyribonuclease V subunit beta [Alteromonas sp. McT4-15]MCB4435851.1 exodeoxyribonuclease V subunit beta [Alteromonas sp. McT4-15]
MTTQLLDVVAMPLYGRHLIEASAGTGKTFNITRLYLRFLLEKKLTVKDILVMTFTKAATEEIKGRVAKTLREATQIWQHAKDNGGVIADDCDPVYIHLFNNNDVDESLARLKAAQLELDEASVFTIHGFCQHVIAQLAFNSGFAMSLNLGNDTSELYLQAAEDYIRKVSVNEDDFLLLAQSGWHVPERLLSEFNTSVRSTLTPLLLDENAIEDAFINSLQDSDETALSQFAFHSRQIEDNEELLVEQLIKTPAHKKERPQELAALKAWLRSVIDEKIYVAAPPQAQAFLDGRRYARNKSGVKEILTPIKDLAKAIDEAVADKEAAIAQIPVFRLIEDAIGFIKTRVAQQKKQLGIIDFDDLIRMLAEEVIKPNNTLVPELRRRFPVALIDEFQDTDAKQYAILDAVYPNANVTQVNLGKGAENIEVSAPLKVDSALLMIGDPKQAIYRFRGGDIFTYLKAGRQADFRWVMNTNWRSVEGMVKAYNRLFYGAPVATGEPSDVFGFGINYNPVKFTPKASAANTPLFDPLSDGNSPQSATRSAMNYVSMHMDDKQDATSMRRNMASWIAQEIYRLLNEAYFEEGPCQRTVRPADIAILVKDRTEANIVKYVLGQQGIASVYLSDRSNLFATPEAKDVLRLLSGIWHATDNNKVASSLASPLWGYSPQTLIELLYHENDALWDRAFDKVMTLREMWLQKGCMSVLLYLMQSSYQPFGSDVERALTNYQHLAEVLEKASTTHQRPEQLLDWLNHQIHQPDSDEELTLRLESDSQLIRLITQHGSKGLEYPIVFIPFATAYKDAARNGKSMSNIFTYYDEQKEDLQLQLGQTKQAISRVRAEGAAEDMRLAYVAVTRAAHRCYMGILPLDGNEKSALARAMNIDNGQLNWRDALEGIAKENEAFACHINGDDTVETYTAVSNNDVASELYALQFTGTSSEEWRLYSFSALSRLTTYIDSQGQHASNIDNGISMPSIPVMQTVRDEEIVTENTLSSFDIDVHEPDTLLDTNALRFTLAKGASAGNLLHDLLEQNDFSEPQWEETGKEMIARFGLDEAQTPALYEWLDEVLQTPLFPNVQLSLCDLTLQQTLREAEFYFPLAKSQWSALQDILTQHRHSVFEKIGGQAHAAPSLITEQLEGMMHGFIDLIFEHEGKFYVADYKSTWLGDSVSHYKPEALFENNQHHLYDLQYLIYCLALHRYLGNTLNNYEPSEHFGGVYYLYLRGMHPGNSAGEGVFYCEISTELLLRLDAVFGAVTDSVIDKNDTSAALLDEPDHSARDESASETVSAQQQFSFDDDWE